MAIVLEITTKGPVKWYIEDSFYSVFKSMLISPHFVRETKSGRRKQMTISQIYQVLPPEFKQFIKRESTNGIQT